VGRELLLPPEGQRGWRKIVLLIMGRKGTTSRIVYQERGERLLPGKKPEVTQIASGKEEKKGKRLISSG